MYVPAAGKLMAVAEPAHPLRLPASLSLYQRWSLGGQDGDSEGSSSSPASGGLGVHAALLEARTRRRWGEGSGKDTAAADPASRFRDQASWQRCSFVLDLVTAQPAAADAADPVQPLRHKVRHSRQSSGNGSSGSSSSSPEVASYPDGSAPGQAAVAQSDGYPGDDSSSWQARQEAAAPASAAPQGMLLQGALTSRDCGLRLTLTLAPVKVDEYYSKAVSECALRCNGYQASMPPQPGCAALQPCLVLGAACLPGMQHPLPPILLTSCMPWCLAPHR